MIIWTEKNVASDLIDTVKNGYGVFGGITDDREKTRSRDQGW